MDDHQDQGLHANAPGTEPSGQQGHVATDAAQVPHTDQIQTDPTAQATPPGTEPKFELVEPTDQRERTQLGRRVSEMERNVNALIQEIRNARLNPQLSQPERQTPDDEMISTVGDLRRFMSEERNREEREKNVQRERYQHDFLQEVQRLGMEDPELHHEVTREMFEVSNSPFNQYRTGNGIADASWNYARAVKAVLSKKLASPTRGVQPGQTPARTAINTGIPMGTRTAPQNTPEVPLDEHAREFLRRTGRDSQWASKILQSKEE